MLQIYFAPLQGYTDHVYRCIHNEIAGGIDCYYTPFVRWEKGAVRNKDIRDILPENNTDVNVIPQIIAASRDEFCHLCDLVQENGWKRIDLNMGCPFPMQTKLGRGSGLLQHPDEAEKIFAEMMSRKEVVFSVKMRLGYESADEGIAILQMLNDINLDQVVLHPRLGVQQYKGSVDMDGFARLAEICTHPMVYNGDIVSVSQITDLERKFPKLTGVMIGRGLLCRPTLAMEYKNGSEMTANQRLEVALRMHDAYYADACNFFRGDSQILTRMRVFWEFQTDILPKKIYKRLMKCGNVKNYEIAMSEAKQGC